MPPIRIRDRLVPAAFFLALTLVYVSLAPLSIDGMGYASENLATTQQVISRLGPGPGTPIVWPRHGLVEPLLGLPFVLVGRLLGAEAAWDDTLYSLPPIAFTALLCTLLLVWVSEVAGRAWGLWLAGTAAFATILWPYAYIGLEPAPSLFLGVAGYLALRPRGSEGWRACVAFGLAAGLAMSTKLTGMFLLPALLFLVFCFFRRGQAQVWRAPWPRVAVVLLLMGGVFWLAVLTRGQYWSRGGRRFVAFNTLGLGEDEPLMAAFGVWSALFSINKGLLVFVPVAILCLLAARSAWRVDARAVVFALLVLGGVLAGLSLFVSWSDELWGPRYLHCSIAPLIVCYGIARQGRPFRVRQEAGWLALAAAGTAIAFLGVFFYYGHLYGAAARARISTLQAYQHDPDFNHIRFNLRLLRIWWRGPSDAVERWPEPRIWVWSEPPAHRESIPKIDVRRFAVPQPVVARGWGASAPAWAGRNPTLVRVLAGCLVLGLGLMAWIAWGVWSAEAGRRAVASPPTARTAVG